MIENFDFRSYIDASMVLNDVTASNAMEALTEICKFALTTGYVKSSFLQAVLERERMFPTGLSLPRLGIAIPHTNSEHVLRSGVIIVKLKQSLLFHEMIDKSKEIPVQYVFLLMLKNDGQQVFLLQNLINLCMDEEVSAQLLQCNEAEEIYDLVYSYFHQHQEV